MKTTQTPMDIFHGNLFEVNFIAKNVDKKLLDILSDAVITISDHEIKFTINEADNSIPVIDALAYFLNKSIVFDVHIKFHNKTGDVVGILKYKSASFENVEFFDRTFSYETNMMRDLELDLNEDLYTYAYIKYSVKSWNDTIIK